ncbi:MAG: alcohol dehydrogenase catalytic domain-containing protein [Oscillospiraceae bacterium]|nr:alcohol dehydrogenase catalytic domain-containing protein [Oscillospiraceae bacterium]
MKAALMYGPNDIRFEEVKRPDCPPGGLILKVMAIGICGSDIRDLTTDSRGGDYPYIYGHEIVGIVDEVSGGQTEYKLGDRLYIYPGDHCLRCAFCRVGKSELCDQPGKYKERQGGFADFVPVTAEQLSRDAVFRVPDGVSYVRASMGEPMSSVYACLETIDVRLGDTVVIIGAGPIGCFLSQVSKMRGASKVIVIEINQKRLEMTRDFGVDVMINGAEEDALAAVLKHTDGKGADHVISANPSTVAQTQGVYMTKKGGTLVWFGGVPRGALVEIDTNYVHYNGIWIYGHYGSSSMQVQKAFALAISDIFPVDKFVTHVLPLREINRGIALTKSGEAIKVVLEPNTEISD